MVAVPDTALSGAGCGVVNCFLEDAGAICVSDDGAHCAPFRTPVLGKVHTNPCWPFSDCQFDTLNGYSGSEVLQFIDQDTGLCLLTDSVHSRVIEDACGSHNAGTYWVPVAGGNHGVCTPGFWLVNVGITNNYDPYPYGEALFLNTDGLFYVATNRPIGNDDQFCMVPQS